MLLIRDIIEIFIILSILYFLAIMPRLRHKPDYSMFQKQHFYAHRGLHDNQTDAPENSMRAFEKAIRAGYGIELDIQLTKDGIPVVFHDDTLNRICNVDGKIESYTYKELQQFSLFGTDQKIPRFDEVLQLVSGKVPLIVEHKMEVRSSSKICKVAAPMLKEYQGEYCMESFHPLGVRWYKRNEPMVIRGQLSQLFHKRERASIRMRLAFFSLEHLLFNFITKPDFIAYDCRDALELSRIICKGVYKNIAVAWTVKSQEELEQIKPYFDVYIFEGFLPEQGKRAA